MPSLNDQLKSQDLTPDVTSIRVEPKEFQPTNEETGKPVGDVIKYNSLQITLANGDSFETKLSKNGKTAIYYMNLYAERD